MTETRPLAAVFGCSGTTLTEAERSLFGDANPFGFILFARNCESPDQVRVLVDDFRECVGRENAPVLIDQEGGRVARLKPPHWRAAPATGRFARLAQVDRDKGTEAAKLNARLIAADLHALGITVDCIPVLDLPRPGSDPIIGDRASGSDTPTAVSVGRAICEGLLEGGVLPVIKHIPGHGRASVDSHEALPEVSTPQEDLEATDFAPFRALNGLPWAMTAHVLFSSIDPRAPATLSPIVIQKIIRDRIGFAGLLISDDLSMGALGGGIGDRASGALAAGCDLALHCNGEFDEMETIAEVCPGLSDAAMDRAARAETWRRTPRPFDGDAALARLDQLLGEAAS